MPLYEFQCTECDRSFEELVRSASAIAEVKCPECGSEHVRRQVSTFASKLSEEQPLWRLPPRVLRAAPEGFAARPAVRRPHLSQGRPQSPP